MDSIIRQAVREELRRSSCSRPETASSTNQDDQGRSENESGAAGSSRSSFSSRLSRLSRLSGLLNRMRKGGGKESSSKKRKVVKEHRIQVRWLHYDPPKKAFVPVRQKNGGGNGFSNYWMRRLLNPGNFVVSGIRETFLVKSCILGFGIRNPAQLMGHRHDTWNPESKTPSV